MSQYRERPECRVKRLNILCHCVTCVQIVHGVKVAIESEVRGTLANSEIECCIYEGCKSRTTNFCEKNSCRCLGFHVHCLIKCTGYTAQHTSHFTHSAEHKVHQSEFAGVGQLKHPLQDHHSQVVVGAISLKFVKNNLHNLVLLSVAV